MSTASAVLRHPLLVHGPGISWYLCLLLRRYWDFHFSKIFKLLFLVPMSTASAVLRHSSPHFLSSIPRYLCLLLRRYWDIPAQKNKNSILGTYVYCFGGIETDEPLPALAHIGVPMSTASAVLRHQVLSNHIQSCGTYVYCFGGIET